MTPILRRFASPLLVLLMIALVSCGSSSDSDDVAQTNEDSTEQGDSTPTDSPAATAVPEATAEPTAEPVEPTPEPAPEAVDEFATLIEATLASAIEGNDGGAAAYVNLGGREAAVAAGAADADGTLLEANTRFRVGSVSKPFVATMILQMAEEGAVDLDAPLATYLPDTPVAPDISLRLLLSHRSGVPSYTDQPTMISEVMADQSRWFEPNEILAWIDGQPLAPADEQFAYSNTNYLLLGQVVEAVDGTDLNASLQTRIAQPLGLADTFFPNEETVQAPGLAASWSPGFATGDETDYRSMVSSAWSAGALISTTSDLAAFMEGLFDGSLLDADSIAAMSDTGPDGYGLGLMVFSLGPGNEAFGHGGLIPGYIATMAYSPTSGDTMVILTNNDRVDPQRVALSILSL